MRNLKIKQKKRQRGVATLTIVAAIILIVILIIALVTTCSKDDSGAGGVTVASAQQELTAVIDGLVSEGTLSDAELRDTATGVIGGLSGAGLTKGQIQEVCREAVRVIRARIQGPTTSAAMSDRLRQLLRAVQTACSQ